MMMLFYNLLLCFVLLNIAPIILMWFLIKPKHAAGFWQKMTGQISFLQQANIKNRIILHAVSVGELMAARPIIEWLSQKPNTQLVITSTTQTGFNLAAQLFPAVQHYFLPYDLPWSLSNFFNRIKPTHVLVMETELWPNLAEICQRREIQLILLNGRLSERSFKGYQRIHFLLKIVLSDFTECLMQTEGDASRLIQLGANPDKCLVMGNLKFCYSPPEMTSDIQSLRQTIYEVWQLSPVLLIASTHPGEEALLLNVYQQLLSLHPTLKLIIAPRHPERFDSVNQHIQNQFSESATCRSKIQEIKPDTKVLLLDSIGELNQLYSIATVVVVGGSFLWPGGHNILEPMASNVAVVTGPHMKNFEAITHLALETGALVQPNIVDDATIFNCLNELLSHPGNREKLIQTAQQMRIAQQAILPRYKQALEKYL